jgi:RNA polymerase sigma-70 factor (ECF subfamily)
LADASVGDTDPDHHGRSNSPTANSVLAALEALPEEEREVFNLVHLQGMSHAGAAEVIGCSTKTVQRRLTRGLVLLSTRLRDVVPLGVLSTSNRAGQADQN